MCYNQQRVQDSIHYNGRNLVDVLTFCLEHEAKVWSKLLTVGCIPGTIEYHINDETLILNDTIVCIDGELHFIRGE